MIEKGVDASCSEDEASDFEEIEAEGDNDKSIPKNFKALASRPKGQTGIRDCFISLKKLDMDTSAMMKHLGFKWTGDSIGTIKDKVYYSQVFIFN